MDEFEIKDLTAEIAKFQNWNETGNKAADKAAGDKLLAKMEIAFDSETS
jgi:hypothetical protein